VDNLSEEVRKGLREKAEQRLQTVDRERARLQQARPVASVKAAKMLGLAKQAENLYKSQVPTEQRRMLELVLSNCTFDRRSVCPTYAKPFDLIVKGQKHELAGRLGRVFATGHSPHHAREFHNLSLPPRGYLGKRAVAATQLKLEPFFDAHPRRRVTERLGSVAGVRPCLRV
jgi:hypothetical protein